MSGGDILNVVSLTVHFRIALLHVIKSFMCITDYRVIKQIYAEKDTWHRYCRVHSLHWIR